jgi:hypothetical protein
MLCDMKHAPSWKLAYVTWRTVSSDTLVGYTGPTANPKCQIMEKTLTFSKQTAVIFSAMIRSDDTWRPLLLWCVAVMLCCTLQGVEHPGSVFSIMTQWWHLMVLQYVSTSFHLPSVSTANTNAVRYLNTYKRSDMSTIPAVWLSKVLLPQANIMAGFLDSHSSLFSDVCPVLPTYSYHNITQFTVYSIRSHAGNLFILLSWLHKESICC